MTMIMMMKVITITQYLQKCYGDTDANDSNNNNDDDDDNHNNKK